MVRLTFFALWGEGVYTFDQWCDTFRKTCTKHYLCETLGDIQRTQGRGPLKPKGPLTCGQFTSSEESTARK